MERRMKTLLNESYTATVLAWLEKSKYTEKLLFSFIVSMD